MAAVVEQDKRRAEDAWQERVNDFLAALPKRPGKYPMWTTLFDVMREGVGIEVGRMTNVADQKHAVRCLKRAGWRRHRDDNGAKPWPWRYRPG